MIRDLLDIEDPLLPKLRRTAAKQAVALDWLLESAKHWAVGEFLRREERRENGETLIYDMDRRLSELARHQVAIWVNEDQHFYNSGRLVGRIYVGLLDPLCNAEYFNVSRGFGRTVGGMSRVLDVVELPAPFRVHSFP